MKKEKEKFKMKTEKAFDIIIAQLEKIKSEITIENYHLFSINYFYKRDLEPIQSFLGPISFEQTSGNLFTIVIEDNRKKGKALI